MEQMNYSGIYSLSTGTITLINPHCRHYVLGSVFQLSMWRMKLVPIKPQPPVTKRCILSILSLP